jgi:ketosteroid isomerase-like protein
MSQENVEVIRKAIEARNRDLDEWESFFDPGVRSSDALIAVGMRTETQGIDELRSHAEKWEEAFDEFRAEIVELVDLGEQLVLAEVRFHGQGEASGASVTVSQVDFYRVREGLITEYRSGYRSRQEALEAAGLSE